MGSYYHVAFTNIYGIGKICLFSFRQAFKPSSKKEEWYFVQSGTSEENIIAEKVWFFNYKLLTFCIPKLER